MKFSETYPSPRALAIEHGLAIPGRGRLSREATALVAQARQAGVTFESDAPVVRSPRTEVKPATEDPVASDDPDVIPEHLFDGVHYARRPDPGNHREPTGYKGLTEEGFTIGWSMCFRCTSFSAHCPCPEGPKPPSIVVKVTDQYLLTPKP
jgi:hypothetical protein